MLTTHAAGPHMAKLLRTKLSEDRYLVESRPVANENETLTVDFGISLLQIREVVSIKARTVRRS